MCCNTIVYFLWKTHEKRKSISVILLKGFRGETTKSGAILAITKFSSSPRTHRGASEKCSQGPNI